MSKQTKVHSTDGKITGKTVVEKSGDYTRITHSRNDTPGSIWGPSYSPTSTTVTDPKGNTSTKKYK